jgi:hypothetical protein
MLKSSNIWEGLLTNETLIEDEIKRTLNLVNACYQSVFLSALWECKIIILAVVMYGCEAWCLTLKGGGWGWHSVRLLTSIFDRRRVGVIGGWRKLLDE